MQHLFFCLLNSHKTSALSSPTQSIYQFSRRICARCTQVCHPSALGPEWDFQRLLRHHGRSAVVLMSAKGLALKGRFVRTTMAVPVAVQPGESGNGSSDHGDTPRQQQQMRQQEVALFMGSPWLSSLEELPVRVMSHILDESDIVHP